MLRLFVSIFLIFLGDFLVSRLPLFDNVTYMENM